MFNIQTLSLQKKKLWQFLFLYDDNKAFRFSFLLLSIVSGPGCALRFLWNEKSSDSRWYRCLQKRCWCRQSDQMVPLTQAGPNVSRLRAKYKKNVCITKRAQANIYVCDFLPAHCSSHVFIYWGGGGWCDCKSVLRKVSQESETHGSAFFQQAFFLQALNWSAPHGRLLLLSDRAEEIDRLAFICNCLDHRVITE